MDVRVGSLRRLNAEEVMLLNCCAGEDSWLWTAKEIKPVNPKGNQPWLFIGRTDAEAEAPILWLPDVKNWLIGMMNWCWERLKAGGEGDDSGWDGWMASPTWWTWVWVNSRSWWWTGRSGVLRSVGSQRAGLACVPELAGHPSACVPLSWFLQL